MVPNFLVSFPGGSKTGHNSSSKNPYHSNRQFFSQESLAEKKKEKSKLSQLNSPSIRVGNMTQFAVTVTVSFLFLYLLIHFASNETGSGYYDTLKNQAQCNKTIMPKSFAPKYQMGEINRVLLRKFPDHLPVLLQMAI